MTTKVTHKIRCYPLGLRIPCLRLRTTAVQVSVKKYFPQMIVLLQFNSGLNATDPCSEENYIQQLSLQIKPFSYHFTMMYVYCCSILLILLFVYLRKKVYRNGKAVHFFKVTNPKFTIFSSGAGMTLVVVSIIIAILAIHAATNIYVAGFLVVLNVQATIVAAVALFKISHLPCTFRKDGSKYAVIFMIFYFFNVLNSVFIAVTNANDLTYTPEQETVLILQFVNEISNIIQAFLHGVLILIGFYTIVPPHVLRRGEMPTTILVHLAATKTADLISSVFSSESKLEKFEFWFTSSTSIAETTSGIVWTVLDSILSPAEEFAKLFTIICLFKLHKIWTMAEMKSVV